MSPEGDNQSVSKDDRRRNCTDFSMRRQDIILLVVGLLYLVAIIGASFLIGGLRGWCATSGYTHDTCPTSRERFLPEPYAGNETGVHGRDGPDAASRWYYWKLPPDKVTWYTRLVVWSLYISHQLLIWFTIYLAQKHKKEQPRIAKYSSILWSYQWWALTINAVFHFLHLLQTHLLYDATAQDVSVSSSQSSVIAILIFIIMLQYRERGIFFGWPSIYSTGKWSIRLRLPQEPINIVRQYHGYAFAWGAIYTFWYHPFENTLGHALGFFHTGILMLQGGLMYTPVHLNKYWQFVLECWVALHGTLVAFQTGGPDLKGTSLWPMFGFGFFGALVITQIFILPFWRRIHAAFRLVPLVIYMAIVIYSYSWIPDKNGRTWVRMNEIIRIPSVFYLLFFWCYLFLYLLLKCTSTYLQSPAPSSHLPRKIIAPVHPAGVATISTSDPPPAVADIDGPPADSNDETPPTEHSRISRPANYRLRMFVCILSVLVIYGVFVYISFLAQYYDLEINLVVLMVVYSFVFCSGEAITFVISRYFFKRLLVPNEVVRKDYGSLDSGLEKKT